MKKLLVLLVASTLILGLLVSCANASGSDDIIRIGLSMPERDQWLSYLEQAIINHSSELGVRITAFDSQRDIVKQLSHVQTFSAQNFDAIIVCIIEAPYTEEVIAAARGVPVIFVNREPELHLMQPGKVGYVGSDEKTSGILQAQFLSEYFAGRTDPINYVMLMGILGHPGAVARTASFRQGMIDNGFTINSVFEQTANFDRAEAMNLMQQFLGTGVAFDAVIANNDEMALGAIEAMRAVGITDVPVVGVDANPSACDSIKAGELAASVFQNPIGQGVGALELALKAARGEDFETTKWIPFELVTIENVHNYWQ